MKIGILTFHCAHNYGAVLQCYALQETLKDMGHDVEVIDYRPEYLLAPYRIFDYHRLFPAKTMQLIKNLGREFLIFNRRRKRYKAFNDFISTRLNLSGQIQGNDIPSKYDIYIMGSDQIWNPKITKGFDPVYFGEFLFDKGEKKYISYAASMEVNSLNEDEKSFYKKSLANFDSISVRESQLAALLQPLTDKKIEFVLDPTLLADINIWNKIAESPNINVKYVLVYQVRINDNALRIANEIAKKNGAIVINILTYCTPYLNRHKLQCESPERFLGLIKNAFCVVTTSFHGTAFSIIFNRPFYSISIGSYDTRVMSLLRNVGLEKRLVPKDSSPNFSEIDYSDVNINVFKLRNKSKDFLIKAIGQ